MEALFPYRLSSDRLGKSHATLRDMQSAMDAREIKIKEYSLVLVTDPVTRRILLGYKKRGFGKNLYNSFGGKIEKDETAKECAIRELEEESGIKIPSSDNDDAFYKVATLHFTFEDDDDTKMLVHVFRLNVTTITSNNHTNKDDKGIQNEIVRNNNSSNNDRDCCFVLDTSVIRECDKMRPEWFSDWYEIPLDTMFADDSLWLTRVLASETERIYVEGHFHFEPGGQDKNTIRHYFMDITTTNGASSEKKKEVKMNLERRLFRALASSSSSPSTKEFNEALAFVKAVHNSFGKRSFDVVLDVAGGHGAIAALFLILSDSIHTAVVIDPARVGNIQKAWGQFFSSKNKVLEHRYECLRTGLPAELDRHRQHRVLVVACHACQHLSEEILQTTLLFKDGNVAAAVMPCCQTDPTHSWKRLSKNLNWNVAVVMDLLLAGKCMSFLDEAQKRTSYTVRMKVINSKITPQNRIILCRPNNDDDLNNKNTHTEKAHQRLERAYRNAHKKLVAGSNNNSHSNNNTIFQRIDNASLILGIAFGAAMTAVLMTRR